MRLAVLSDQRTRESIFLRNVVPPLEDALAALPGATLVRAPGGSARRPGGAVPAWLAAIRTARKAEAVFWIQFHLRPSTGVWALAYTNPLAARAILAIEQWERGIEYLGRIVEAQRLHVCFVLYRQAYIELRRRFPLLPFVRLRLGFHRGVFNDLGLERDLFAFWMGRRHQPLHHALERYCRERGLRYRYSQAIDDPPTVTELNRLISQSHFFVVTPPNLQNPQRTGRFSPVTSRYLEGPGSGARLLGVRPFDRDEFTEFLPEDALVECAPDGSDLAAVLDEAQEAAGGEEHRREVRDHVHARHGWERRAVEIHRYLEHVLERA